MVSLLTVHLIEIAHPGQYNTVAKLVDMVEMLLYDPGIYLNMVVGIAWR